MRKPFVYFVVFSLGVKYMRYAMIVIQQAAIDQKNPPFFFFYFFCDCF